MNTLHVTDRITLTWVVDDLDSPPDNQGSPLVMESLDYPMVLVRYAPLYVVPLQQILVEFPLELLSFEAENSQPYYHLKFL